MAKAVNKKTETKAPPVPAPVPSKHFDRPAPVAPMPPPTPIPPGPTTEEQAMKMLKEFLPVVMDSQIQVVHERAYLNFAGQAMAAMLPRAEHVTPEMVAKIAATSWDIAGAMMAAKPEFNEPGQ